MILKLDQFFTQRNCARTNNDGYKQIKQNQKLLPQQDSNLFIYQTKTKYEIHN